MYAVHSTFEMADLARRETRTFERKRLWLETCRKPIEWMVGFPAQILAGLVSRMVDRVARDMAAQAVWFRGAREAVSSRDTAKALDPKLELVGSVDSMERHIADFRRSTQRLLERSKRNALNGRLTGALGRAVGASDELQCEVLSFRDAVLLFEGRRGTFAVNPAAEAYFAKVEPAFAKLVESRARMEDAIASLRQGDVGHFDPSMFEEAREANRRAETH